MYIFYILYIHIYNATTNSKCREHSVTNINAKFKLAEIFNIQLQAGLFLRAVSLCAYFASTRDLRVHITVPNLRQNARLNATVAQATRGRSSFVTEASRKQRHCHAICDVCTERLRDIISRLASFLFYIISHFF